jgi:hypothetical protein
MESVTPVVPVSDPAVVAALTTELTDRLAELAADRRTGDALAERITEARRAFEDSIEASVADLTTVDLAIATLTADVKRLALRLYGETGSQHPVDGVDVKILTKLDYKPELALSWARQAGVAVIPEQLDVKAFEKIAKQADLPFVEKFGEPQAQIARDLTAYYGAQ